MLSGFFVGSCIVIVGFGCGESVREELGNESVFVGLDANAAPPGDVIIQISLADSYSACQPSCYDVAAPHGPADRIVAELQLVGGLLNGQ